MGKYMKKNKMGGAVVDISMGVRTRARTLALEQLNKQKQQQQQQNVLNFCYLELRSRKLEKVQEKPKAPKSVPRPPQHTAKRQRAQEIAAVVSISQQEQEQQLHQQVQEAESNSQALLALRTGEAEASCGENAFDHDANSSRDSFCTSEHFRRVREHTPVCFDEAAAHQLAEAPGSSSRPARGAAVVPMVLPSSRVCSMKPSHEEIEDFFSQLEDQPEAEGLCDRYNYDFLNDVPLPGRFDWTSPEAAAAAGGGTPSAEPVAA